LYIKTAQLVDNITNIFLKPISKRQFSHNFHVEHR
jgi:hypothetical protein